MPSTRKKKIKPVYKDEEGSDASLSGDFSDSGSEVDLSEVSEESSEAISDDDFVETKAKTPASSRKTQPRKKFFVKDFLNKLSKQASLSDGEEGEKKDVPFSIKDLTESDKLLPAVLQLSESESSDDESQNQNKTASSVNQLSFQSNLQLNDKEQASTSQEYIDVFSSNIRNNSMELAQQNFDQFQKHSDQLAETKAHLDEYSSRRKKEKKKKIKVADLLAMGEEQTENNAILQEEIAESSADSDWEEVKEAKQIPQSGIQLVVDFPGAEKKKSKALDVEMMMKRKINRVKKEYQIYMHKVHVLCWIAHGNYVNKVLNDHDLLATALSLLPSDKCYPSERVDLKYIEGITTWYRDKMTIKQDKYENKFKPNAPGLNELLKKQMQDKIVTTKKYLVLIFILMLRALGINCRVMFNFVTVPIRPPQSELCSLSLKKSKTEEKTSKTIDKQSKNSKKTVNKAKSKGKPISQLDGNDDDSPVRWKSQNKAKSDDKLPTTPKQKSSTKENYKIIKKQLTKRILNLSNLKKSYNDKKSPKSTSVSPCSKSPFVSKVLNYSTSLTFDNIKSINHCIPSSSKKCAQENLNALIPKIMLHTPKGNVKILQLDGNDDTEIKSRKRRKTKVELMKKDESPTKEPEMDVKKTKSSASNGLRRNKSTKQSTSASVLQEEKKSNPKISTKKVAEKANVIESKKRLKKSEENELKTELENRRNKVKSKFFEESKTEANEAHNTKKAVDIMIPKSTTTDTHRPVKDSDTEITTRKRRKMKADQLKEEELPKKKAKSEVEETKKSETSDLRRSVRHSPSPSVSQKENKSNPVKNKSVRLSSKTGPKTETAKVAEKTSENKSKQTAKKSEEKDLKIDKNGKKVKDNVKSKFFVESKTDANEKKSTKNAKQTLKKKAEDTTPRLLRLSLNKDKAASPAGNDKVTPKQINKTPGKKIEVRSTHFAETEKSPTAKKPEKRVSHRDLIAKEKAQSTPQKKEIKKDLIKLVKNRMREVKAENKMKKVKDDDDSDYVMEANADSDIDFKPTKVTANRKSINRKSAIDRRVVSSDEENSTKKNGVDVWCEVYVEDLQEWISVDVVKAKVHCVNEIYNRASHPVGYVIAWDNSNYLKDVTRRYVPHWNTVTRKLRAEPSWLETAFRPWKGPKTPRDIEEDKQLDRMQLDAPLPKVISEYKNHPLYALRRHLLKFEALYPADAPPLGFVREEPVYARECVYTCRSRDTWLKEAKVVRPGEQPYKIVKARPKWDRLSNKAITDRPLEVFGPWQVQDYEPPAAENGIVPRNAYGNVELFKKCMLPKGTVHITLPGLNKVAKKLNIDCASAMTGFDFHGGWTHPVFDGFVVCQEFEKTLTEAWLQEQEEQERKDREKVETRVYGNWKKLIKGLLIRERLREKYSFEDPKQTVPKTKSKGPRFAVKKNIKEV